ncbi:hypothetical protein MPSEU_000164000 [Mayamaea pseudoterrestris]|nr:hypothetical protein MPSEU_000164000 [Mayamaea pseudoterrestris]
MTDPVSNSSNSNGQPQQQENIGMIVDAATTLSSINNEEQQHTSIVSNEPQQRESEKTSATYDSSDGPLVSDHFDGEEHVATTANDKESTQTKDTAAAAESTEALSEPISLNDDAEQQKTRFLPENKKPDAAPTFPEKLMKMMKWASAEGLTSVEWVDDGKAFVINQPDSFTKEVVPRFFKATKFSSFTRKLYRWGFRQVNRGIGPDDPIIFGNDSFQRDHEELICKMKSVTAASARKQDVKPMLPVYMEQQQQQFAGVKHELMDIGGGGMAMDDQTAKRMMLSQLYQQKAGMLAQQHSNPSMYGLMNAHGQLSLTNALRPANIGGYSNQQQQQQQQPQGLMHMQQPMNHNQQQQHIMSMHASTADNVHQQLLQLHHMQMLGQDSGMQQQLGDANDLEQHFQQQQQTYQLALQQMQQQQQQPNMSMQAPYPQLAMSSFQPAMNDGGNNSNMQQQQQCNNMGNNGGGNILYDYIPQNAYGNPGSTVEIVNAAISALRYAN